MGKNVVVYIRKTTINYVNIKYWLGSDMTDRDIIISVNFDLNYCGNNE